MTTELIPLLAPELTLVAGAMVVLMLGLSRSEPIRSSTGFLAFMTILAALVMAWVQLPDSEQPAICGLHLT